MSDQVFTSTPLQAGLRQVAYHEAGHLVLACITGVYHPGKRGISIAGKHIAYAAYRGDPLLVVHRSPELSEAALADALAIERGIINAAGYAAEHRFLVTQGFDPDTEVLTDGARGDMEALRENNGGLSVPFDDDDLGLFERFTAAADGYFEEPAVWAAVTAVAEGLCGAPTHALNGLSAYELIQGHYDTSYVRLLALPATVVTAG
jgi:hypothetical protein